MRGFRCGVSDTPIAPTDDILEMRWNNFNNGPFPGWEHGLMGSAPSDYHSEGAQRLI